MKIGLDFLAHNVYNEYDEEGDVMLKDRLKLEEELLKHFDDFCINPSKGTKYYQLCYETYDIPGGLVSDYVTRRKELGQANNFELYLMLDCLQRMEEVNQNRIDYYFSSAEKEVFGTSKYYKKEIKFPLILSCLQVAEDQWIGTIPISQLVLLNEAQLINYNANTQRPLQRIAVGDKSLYKIDINKRSLKEIKELVLNQEFIFNTITLNISPLSSTNFRYSEKRKELIILSMESIDVLDGYHRFLAFTQAFEDHPELDHDIELRITNFGEDKARRFIFQEYQRNLMRRDDLETYKSSEGARKVVARLMASSDFIFSTKIGARIAINSMEMEKAINYVWFEGIKKKQELLFVPNISKELMEDFESLASYDAVYLEREYSFRDIFTIIIAFKYFQDKDKANMPQLIEGVMQKQAAQNLKPMKEVGKAEEKAVLRLIKEVEAEREGKG